MKYCFLQFHETSSSKYLCVKTLAKNTNFEWFHFEPQDRCHIRAFCADNYQTSQREVLCGAIHEIICQQHKMLKYFQLNKNLIRIVLLKFMSFTLRTFVWKGGEWVPTRARYRKCFPDLDYHFLTVVIATLT